MIPKFKAAMFDMDGTLLCTMRYWRFSTLEFLLVRDIIPTPEQLGRMYDTSSKRLCAEILEQHGMHMEQRDIVRELEGYMRRHYLYDAHTKPHTMEYLEKLRAEGIKMCVGTGSPREFAKDGLDRLKIAQYMEFIEDCYHGLTKKEPAYFEWMAQRLGVQPHEMCVFEDAIYAMKSAKAAGCPVIALMDGTARADWEEIRNLADHCIEDYSELL